MVFPGSGTVKSIINGKRFLAVQVYNTECDAGIKQHPKWKLFCYLKATYFSLIFTAVVRTNCTYSFEIPDWAVTAAAGLPYTNNTTEVR
jgi:hypothetical protein